MTDSCNKYAHKCALLFRIPCSSHFALTSGVLPFSLPNRIVRLRNYPPPSHPTLHQASLLRVEAYVGVLGLLKSECPKLVNDCLGWVAYLPVNDEADCKLHRNILVSA